MKEMTEIYQEDLLFSPPASFNDENIKSAESQGIYLKEELSSIKNSITANADQPVKRDSSMLDRMELPVNNFLKTLKEIEAEFHFVLNSIKTAFNEIPDSLDSFGRMMKKTEANINNSGMELSGFMEENY
jgi:hypothetical protein